MSSHAEERSDNIRSANGHTRQSLQTSTAQEVEEERFGVVFLMMGYCHKADVALTEQFSEPCVAQISRRHFCAHFLRFRHRLCVEVGTMERHIQSLAELLHKRGIAVGFFIAQMEMTMCRLHGITQVAQHQQKSNRISSTTESYQNTLAIMEQMMANDELADIVCKLQCLVVSVVERNIFSRKLWQEFPLSQSLPRCDPVPRE